MSGMRSHSFGCGCRSHVGRPWRRPEHWSRAEVTLLERSFGLVPDAKLAAKLGRSEVGLRLKAKRLGLRKRAQGWSSREVAAIFGIDAGTVGKIWVRRGLLASVRAFYQGPHLIHSIAPSAVEDFIRRHPEYIDVAKMPDSPYRELAAADPWISLVEVHRLTGRNHHTVAQLIAGGVIRGRKRGAHWFVPASEVPKIRPLQPAHIEDSVFRRNSNLEARRNRRKLAA